MEGFGPRAWPCLFKLGAFAELPIGQAGLGPDELSGRSQGVHGRLCESSSTWLGREENSVEGEEEGRSGREAGRKTPDLVFLKPSSYIANAWSNMGSFIMDKPLAPACKVYHAHCKEVKDWVVFARNVATTSGPCISVCYCCECGMQGGAAALQAWRPGGPGLQTVSGSLCVLRM